MIELATVILGAVSFGLCGLAVYGGYVLLTRGVVALGELDD